MTVRVADVFEPVEVLRAAQPMAPAVFDSPHSGTVYPADFGHSCPLSALRGAEDTYVDELFAAAPAAGAAFIAARFPRSYIDVNRTLDDIDPELLDAPWPDPIRPGEKSKLGKGLVWRVLNSGRAIYARRLTVQELRTRIDGFYRPYHAALDAAIDAVHARFGVAYHVDCHSMPARVVTAGYPQGMEAADFVLGDRDGTTCEPGLTNRADDCLTGLGYRVARNDPYKGVELVRRHGAPALGRHSLQIEVNRRLYLTADFRRSDGFARLRHDLDQLVAEICDYARSRAAGT